MTGNVEVRLRDRYVRGELSDEAFEHRVEGLLETEDVEMLESPTRTTSAVDGDLDLERERCHRQPH